MNIVFCEDKIANLQDIKKAVQELKKDHDTGKVGEIIKNACFYYYSLHSKKEFCEAMEVVQSPPTLLICDLRIIENVETELFEEAIEIIKQDFHQELDRSCCMP